MVYILKINPNQQGLSWRRSPYFEFILFFASTVVAASYSCFRSFLRASVRVVNSSSLYFSWRASQRWQLCYKQLGIRKSQRLVTKTNATHMSSVAGYCYLVAGFRGIKLRMDVEGRHTLQVCHGAENMHLPTNSQWHRTRSTTCHLFPTQPPFLAFPLAAAELGMPPR
jgi:hypothetical protein